MEARHDGAVPLQAEAKTTTTTMSKENQAPATTDDDLAQRACKTLIRPSPTVLANFVPRQQVQRVDDAEVSAFVMQRQAVARFVRGALEAAVHRQKENADKRLRKHLNTITIGDRVLLSTDSIRDASVANLGVNKLAPRFIGPFTVMKALGDAYTQDIPSKIRLHPTFYVGRLKACHPAEVPSDTLEGRLALVKTVTTKLLGLQAWAKQHHGQVASTREVLLVRLSNIGKALTSHMCDLTCRLCYLLDITYIVASLIRLRQDYLAEHLQGRRIPVSRALDWVLTSG